MKKIIYALFFTFLLVVSTPLSPNVLGNHVGEIVPLDGLPDQH